MKKVKEIPKPTMSIDMAKTGENIFNYMTNKGYSAKDIADACGISRQSVYRWLNGETLPTIDRLVDLAEIFAVYIDDLIIKVKI